MLTNTIELAFRGGGVSEEKYCQFSNEEKQAYIQYLANPNESISQMSTRAIANNRILLSNEIYIPAGSTVTIPVNSTLVANGGFYSGTGTLKGQGTKVQAGFEQIFEDTIMISGLWDTPIVHPEWFGISGPSYTINGDGSKYISKANFTQFRNTNNASVAIQKAINMVYYYTLWLGSTTTSDVVYGGMMYTGGKVVCKPGSMYILKNPILLPMGVSFDGGNSNFIYSFPASDSNKFMLYVNADINGYQRASERGFLDDIRNIRLINNISKQNSAGTYDLEYKKALGIFSASQSCTFENIHSEHLTQTFKRGRKRLNSGNEVNIYLDHVTLRNFTLINALNKLTASTEYQLDLGYIGDNLLIENISYDWRPTHIPNLILVDGCGGGAIRNITNGTIFIKNSKAMVISSIHQELGNIILENSQVEINGFTHFKVPGQVPIELNRRSSSYENRPVTIKNGLILYNHNKYKNQFSLENDIQAFGSSCGTCTIENVCRGLQAPWTEASNLYGIRMNNTYFMKNQGVNSISSKVLGSTNPGAGLINNMISYQIQGYSNILSGSYVTQANDGIVSSEITFPAGTYYYSAALIFDKERNLGYYPNHQLTVNVPANSRYVRLSLDYPNTDFYVGMYIRLFRRLSTSNDIYYLDVPVCTSYNMFYDIGTGKTTFGETWSKITISNYQPMNCSNYQLCGNNVKVNMDAFPTKGLWKKGDIIIHGTSSEILTSDQNLKNWHIDEVNPK